MEFNKKVKQELLQFADEKYLKFNQNLKLASKENLKNIGIRLPLLRKYAKRLSKEYKLDYLLENIEEEYYEEVLLKGILIGNYKNLKCSELKKYIKYYVPKISDWGLCDNFCSGLKITKKYLAEIWDILKKYLKSNNEFEVRFALVMILNYYITDDYIEEIYKIISDVKLDKYYVKMANAWLISYCVVKYYDKTFEFLKENSQIEKWTYNKGIQKSIESFRISNEQKESLRKLKRDK